MKKISLIILCFLSVLEAGANTLFPRQWALKNDGQIIYDFENELTRVPKVGLKGIDINWIDTDLIKNENSQDEVVVAIIDSGLDITHPDLVGKIWFNKKRCLDLKEEDRKNQPCNGWNFLNNNGNLSDDVGHGTHVAGIIAALDNQLGIKGAGAKEVKIMPLKVLDANTNDFVVGNRMITDIIADAMRFALENGAHVINMSLGWPGLVETSKIRIAIDRAKEMNVPVIVASGNNGKDVPTFPCTYSSVICVGSHDNQGKISEFSNHGGKIDIYAPGEDIISLNPLSLESRTLRIQGYETKKGSSQAAPFVAATVANLRMIEPNILIDEVYARLLKTSYDNSKRLDMRKTLENRIDYFAKPLFKDLLEVLFDSESHEFVFSLPIKNYLADLENLEILLRLNGEAIKLGQESFKISSLRKGQTRILTVFGKVLDLKSESQIDLEVVLKHPELNLNYSTMLAFSKRLKMGKDFEVNKIDDIDHRLLSYYTADRKSTRMRPIIQSSNANANPEYFYFDPRKDTEQKTVVSLLRTKNQKIESIDIELPKMNRVLYVIKQDFNLDGENDYLVYSLSPDSRKLVFSYYSNDFSDLFSKNHWEMEVTTFEGLPIDGQVEKFSWLKVETKAFGDVLVPVIAKNWEIPEVDNTRHPLERLRNYGERKLYYLNPSLINEGVKLEIRLLSNYEFVKNINESLDIFYGESVSLETPFVQTKSELRKGELNVLLSVGEEFNKRYYNVKFESPHKYKIIYMPLLRRYLESNSVFSINKLEKGEKSERTVFMALTSRSDARLSQVSHRERNERVLQVVTNSYADPIFNYIGGFADEENKEETFFIESRYNVWSFTQKQNGEVQRARLPVNRESSFPGQSFSETLWPLSIETESGKRPGLFINSTLIFGERLYAMLLKDNGDFVRPLGLSVVLPRECISLYSGNNPFIEEDNAETGYLLLCRDENLQMLLGFMKAKI